MPTRGERILPYLLVLPAFAILVPFHVWPAAEALRLSLWDDRPHAAPPEDPEAPPRTASGGRLTLDHYREAIGSEDFLPALSVTLWFALGTVPASLAIGFFAAWRIHQAQRLKDLLRTLFFLPAVTPAFVGALVWRWILDPSAGLLKAILDLGGIPSPEWLLDSRGILEPLGLGIHGPSVALACVIAFSIWQSIGFETVVLLAALSVVPRECFEAAGLDGARGWRLHRSVTIPLLSPTLFLLAVLGTIRSLQTFTPLYLLTRGGVLKTTTNLPYLVFKRYWEQGLPFLGEACALSVLLFFMLAACTWLQRRALERGVYYG